ncbi:MAG: ferredoxin [Pseudomonadota bacterium]
MDYSGLEKRAARDYLDVFGAFHPEPDEALGLTLVLLGPKEPTFWDHFRQSPEYMDGKAHPMDRWSGRVIGALARELSATAHFPFGPPPYAPFITWALRTRRAWSSPAGPLVHDRAGMMVSYRGALALRERLVIPAAEGRPCDACDTRPCLSACPVSALSDREGYDVAACHAWLDAQAECLDKGCLARRACPVSQGFPRREEQSAFHMAAFHKGAYAGT